MSVWYEMEELVPIVGRLARKYTSGDSTSISYEKAEQLMGAVLYCIREAGAQRKWAVADRENLTAETAYLTGAACVEKKTKRALRLYHQILKNFDSYEQHCLNETITKGMPEYFRWYDPIFAPQETLLTLDYPVLEDLKDYTGIDCVERWLSRVKQEQQFLHCFPRADLIWMLEEYDEDYRDGMDNLCEMALSVCVKQVLAGKSLANRVFGREEENRIRETLEQGGARLLDEKIYPVLRKLVSKAGGDADALWFYLFPAIDSAFVRIQYTARHRGQEADDRVIEIELQREVTYETETTTAGLQRQSAEPGTVDFA